LIEKPSAEYLREPGEDDLRRILEINAGRGFPGLVGSIDCKHWKWKSFPLAWAGQLKERKKPTIALEAIADAQLWIWLVFFCAGRSINDVNVLDHSPTIEDIIAGKFPPKTKYLINGSEYDLPYYFANGIIHNRSSLHTISRTRQMLRKNVREAAGRYEELY
jgi:hypothetical protein